jgi:hypothetical protein
MLHFTCDRCKRPIDTDNELRYSIQVRVEIFMGCYQSTSHEDLDPLDQVADELQLLQDESDVEQAARLHSGQTFDLCSSCYRAYIKNPLAREMPLPMGFSEN